MKDSAEAIKRTTRMLGTGESHHNPIQTRPIEIGKIAAEARAIGAIKACSMRL
jgi:hypothetical protein